MPTYIGSNNASDISPSWPNTTIFDNDMITNIAGNGNTNDSIPASSTRSFSFITVAGLPNNDAFEDGGTQTVEIDVKMGDADFRMRVRMVRVNSSGTVLGVKGAFTGVQTASGGQLIFSPVSPTWTGVESCSDRLAIECEIENLDSMSHNLQLNVQITDAEVITDISENTANCVGVRVQNWAGPVPAPMFSIFLLTSLFILKTWDFLINSKALQNKVKRLIQDQKNKKKNILINCSNVGKNKENMLNKCKMPQKLEPNAN